jgi:hypothetical protein
MFVEVWLTKKWSKKDTWGVVKDYRQRKSRR